jgi:quinol monooxygenase YgiN
MTYVVIARWVARPGEEDAVAEAISRLTEPSRAEPGCIVYRPHRELEDPRVFLLYEEYSDRAAYDAHAASEHFRRHAIEGGIPLLETRERSFYEPMEP